METIKLRFVGTAPLLCQSDRLANPLDPLKKKLAAITGKKKKTDADHEEIMKIEFVANMYFDEAIGPFLPAVNIDAAIAEGARMIKRGKDIERAYMTMDDKVPLEYDGPRTMDRLIADPAFMDVRSVVVNNRRTMRVRPIFRDWKATFSAVFDESVIDRADLLDAVTRAGQYAGVGTYRPRFGRFAVEELHG